MEAAPTFPFSSLSELRPAVQLANFLPGSSSLQVWQIPTPRPRKMHITNRDKVILIFKLNYLITRSAPAPIQNNLPWSELLRLLSTLFRISYVIEHPRASVTISHLPRGSCSQPLISIPPGLSTFDGLTVGTVLQPRLGRKVDQSQVEHGQVSPLKNIILS